MKIIYKTEDGKLAVIAPSMTCGLSLKDIADKDVPSGFAYKIVDDNYIPEESVFRDAWEIDNVFLTDGVGL
tara:strand:+ start:368 stop:580 length:213 start_codon:yes stop_codon:yes gene_type:complete